MIYLDDLVRQKTLTHQEHQELFARYKAGDIQARNRIVESVMKLAVSTVNKAPMSDRYREDVLSEAFMKIIISIEKWDGKRPLAKYLNAIVWNVTTTKWSNLNLVYMNPSTARQVNKTVGHETSEEISKHCGVSLKRAREIIAARAVMSPVYYQSAKKQHEQDEFIERDTVVDHEPCIADLASYVAELPLAERECFSLRVGLHGSPLSPKETQARLGISQFECRRLMMSAMNQLRQKVFRDYGDKRIMDDVLQCGYCETEFRPNVATQAFCSARCQWMSKNGSKRKPK